MRIRSVSLIVLLASACAGCTPSSICDRGGYQQTGTAVQRARGLVNARFPEGLPAGFDGAAYKQLLKENDETLYALLEPYDVSIAPASSGYTVTLLSDGIAFLLDYSCTLPLDYWLCELQSPQEELPDPCPR